MSRTRGHKRWFLQPDPDTARFSVRATIHALHQVYPEIDRQVMEGWDDDQRRAAYLWAVEEALAQREGRDNPLPQPAWVAEVVR